MLTRLLEEIQTSGSVDVGNLASRMGVSEAMVEAMLEALERIGKLQKVSDCSTGMCASCSAASFCGGKSSGSPRLWVIPAAGENKEAGTLSSANE